ncbi:MAG: CRISPR-associated primase-polymerase type A1, partial [Desulfomonilaceae bacterium]
MINDSTLAQVRAAVDAGLAEEALDIARVRQTREVVDADLHLAWADILEEMVATDDVIFELNLALRDDPERISTYERLAEVYLDQGQPQRAARVLARLVEKWPDDSHHYEVLGAAFKEARQFEKAREIYEAAIQKTGDTRFKGFLKELGFLERPETNQSGVSTNGPGQIVPARHNLITFTTLFASREGVYARQWVSPTGESGYTPIQEPLSPTVAENHILGNYTIGAYPVRLDNTVNYLAFDFDVAKFAIAKAISSEKLWNSVISKAHAAACKLIDVAAANDIPIYLEDSGFKGRHCWIFTELPVPAGVAKKFGDLLVAQIMPLSSEVTVEVFPKQTSVKKGGLGNLIKLPLGVHKRTGKRSLFINPDGTPFDDQLNFLESVNKAPRRSVYGFIQRISAGMARATAVRPPADNEDPPFEISDEDMRPAPVRAEFKQSYEPPYDIDSDPEFQHLMLKCATLRSIVDKVN